MQKIINNTIKSLTLILIICTTTSCTNNEDLNDLNETLFVRHKNADMPAYIHGNASEKVFLITLHGGPGGVGLGFRGKAFNAIENNCAVVYFDQRGSGASQGSYSEKGISVDIMAEDVLALVKVLKRKYGNESRFFLLGSSWGVTLGTATLLKDQNDFLGWIPVGGTHDPKGLYLEYITNFENIANQQITLGNNIEFWESVNSLIKSVSPSNNKKDFRKMNIKAFNAEEKLAQDNIINTPEEGTNSAFDYNPTTTLWNTLNTQSLIDPELRNLSYTNRLKEIEIPALILSGKYDMVVPTRFSQEAFDNFGSNDKALLIFERSGHSPMFSEPKLFSEKVIEFIDKHK